MIPNGPEESPAPGRCKLEVWNKAGVLQTFDLRRGMGLSALKARKSPIEFDCLEADCGICVVKVLQNSEHLSPVDGREKDFLTAMNADPDERLACQCRILGDVTLKVEF